MPGSKCPGQWVPGVRRGRDRCGPVRAGTWTRRRRSCRSPGPAAGRWPPPPGRPGSRSRPHRDRTGNEFDSPAEPIQIGPHHGVGDTGCGRAGQPHRPRQLRRQPGVGRRREKPGAAGLFVAGQLGGPFECRAGGLEAAPGRGALGRRRPARQRPRRRVRRPRRRGARPAGPRPGRRSSPAPAPGAPAAERCVAAP